MIMGEVLDIVCEVNICTVAMDAQSLKTHAPSGWFRRESWPSGYIALLAEPPESQVPSRVLHTCYLLLLSNLSPSHNHTSTILHSSTPD